MRIFLLLAFAFALISLALVVSQHPSFIEQTRQLIGTSPTRAQDGPNSSDGWETQFEHTTKINMQDDGWQALSGFPSFAKISFPLPRKTELIDGRLRLEIQTQMAQSGAGTLRVAVNDERRAEVVLNPGLEQRTLLLALTQEDLGRPNVTVSLSAQGDTFQGSCPSRPARGLVVDVLSSSGVELAHLTPLEDPLDIWLASVQPPRILVGSPSNGQNQADQLLMAARLRQNGLRANFVVAVTDKDSDLAQELSDSPAMIAVNRKQTLPLIYEPSTTLFSVDDPNAISELLTGGTAIRISELISGAKNGEQSDDVTAFSDTNTQSFFRSNRWRVGYNLIETDGGHAPSRLQLSLKLAEQKLGEEWLVNVRLNNSLLSSERLEGSSGTYNKAVILPVALTQPNNEITIDLSTTDDDGNWCDPGLELTAQLLPDSKLEGTAFLTPDLPAYLIQALARASALNLDADVALTPIQAAASADLLAHILPKETAVKETVSGDLSAAKIEVLTKTALEARLKGLQLTDTTKRFWIVSQDAAEQASYKIVPLMPDRIASETLLLSENAVFLLIEA